jgi:uncharacterized protein
MSQPVWDEVLNVLHRPRLARFIEPEQRDAVLDLMRSVYVWFHPQRQIAECRDAKDNKYLELALEADASIIVSSDDDLLVMNPWRGIRIMLPAAYVSALNPGDQA